MSHLEIIVRGLTEIYKQLLYNRERYTDDFFINLYSTLDYGNQFMIDSPYLTNYQKNIFMKLFNDLHELIVYFDSRKNDQYVFGAFDIIRKYFLNFKNTISSITNIMNRYLEETYREFKNPHIHVQLFPSPF